METTLRSGNKCNVAMSLSIVKRETWRFILWHEPLFVIYNSTSAEGTGGKAVWVWYFRS